IQKARADPGRGWQTPSFFLQAEDRIRRLIVTGVQTCALPISHDQPLTAASGRGGRQGRGPSRGGGQGLIVRARQGAPWAAALVRSEERRGGKGGGGGGWPRVSREEDGGERRVCAARGGRGRCG